MDDGRFDLVEVAQGADNLHDDGAGLLLCHQLVLFQVEVQVISFAELQHCTEPGRREGGDGHTRLHTGEKDLIDQLNKSKLRSTVFEEECNDAVSNL